MNNWRAQSKAQMESEQTTQEDDTPKYLWFGDLSFTYVHVAASSRIVVSIFIKSQPRKVASSIWGLDL